MKQALMLSAIAVGAIAGISNAQAAQYTFGTSGGGEYCNGVNVTPSTYVTGAYNGLGTYNSYCANYYTPTVLGGFKGTIKTLGAGQWITLTDTPGAQGLPPNYVLIDYLNTKALTWYLAFEANATSTYSAVPFEIINEGPLVKGKPQVPAGDAVKGQFIKKTNWGVALAKVKATRKGAN
jgi:hypothetical protein